MPPQDEYLRSQRRRARPWVAVALLGLLGVVAGFVWMPNLALHLVGLGLAGLTAMRAVILLLEGRARALGAAVVTLIVAAGIAVPWRLAEAERSGSPHWTLKTEGFADNLYVDNRRLLFSDDDGLHALDLTDGSIRWSFDDISRIGEVHVAADGHVLVRSDRTEADEVVWLSPDGKPLWRSKADADKQYLMGLNLRDPLASSQGAIVFRRCAEPEAKNEACTYVGVGPDGKKLWDTDGHHGVRPALEQQEGESQYDDAARLPELVVIDREQDGGGMASVVDANDGASIADIDINGSVAVTGETVVYESGPAEAARTCRSHGLSRDGKVNWSAETPCLNGSAVVLGARVYGVDADRGAPAGGGDNPVNDSFMIDTTTGHSKMVGGLALFNNDSDGSVGVPGPDVVVQRDDQHLTAFDPDTGDELWDLRTAGDDVPGVSSAHGAAVVYSEPGRGHNPFYAGDERLRGLSVWAIDTATGHVTGKRTMHDIWNSLPVGPGQVVLVDGEELSLIGSPPD